MSFNSQPDFGLLIDMEPEELWIYSTPKKADHIRVSRGLYNHHGIYVSDDEIIHFTGDDADNILDWSKNEVIQTGLADFLRGGTLEVKEYTEDELLDLYPVDHIVHFARASFGDRGYNLAFNNCEHFANMCTLGRFRSKQVERVIDIILGGVVLPNERSTDDMGLFSRISDAWNAIWGKDKSGGRSSTSTTYEPDKVKIAEIEADTKIRLANKENERIELMKNARLDILEFEVKSNIALEEARAKGLNMMAQTIVAMQEKLHEIGERRLSIIEKGSLQIIKEVEGFYQELANKIEEDKDNYKIKKYPQLLSILEQYEIGSPSHELYRKLIEDDWVKQLQHYTMQTVSIANRADEITRSILQSKERMIEQTGQITNGLLESFSLNHEPFQRLATGESVSQTLLEEKNLKMIERGNRS
jgi:hypothetical protein